MRATTWTVPKISSMREAAAELGRTDTRRAASSAPGGGDQQLSDGDASASGTRWSMSNVDGGGVLPIHGDAPG